MQKNTNDSNINIFGFMDGDGGDTTVDNVIINYFSPKLPSGLYLQIYLDGLMRCFGESDAQFASNARIAEKYGISERSLIDAWAWWENLGLIKRIPRYCKVRYPKSKAEHLDFREKPDGEYKYQCSNAIKFLKNVKLAIAKGEYDLDAALRKQDDMLQSLKDKNSKKRNKKADTESDENVESVSDGSDLSGKKENSAFVNSIKKKIDFDHKSDGKIQSKIGGEACCTPTPAAHFTPTPEACCTPRGEACFTQINTNINNNNILINKTTTSSENENASDENRKDDVVDASQIMDLKSKIEKTIKAKFHIKLIKKLIDLKGKNAIKEYLELWSKLTEGKEIANKSGYFYDAVLNDYIIPEKQDATRTNMNNSYSKIMNFDQRQYTEDFYESMIKNVYK